MGSSQGPMVLVLIVCSALGYVIGYYLPDPFGAYARVLVPYHLFLFFIVVMENDTVGLSLPMGQTIITHLACMALLIGIAMGRRYIPFFGLIGLFIPGLAPFEAEWLFSGGGKTAAKKPEPQIQITAEESADEYVEFMKYMSGSKREFRKMNQSPRDEYNLWRAARRGQETQGRD